MGFFDNEFLSYNFIMKFDLIKIKTNKTGVINEH